jgi:hypothetical protein
MLNKMGVMTVHHSWMRFTTASKGPRDCLLAALAQAVAAASLPWFWLHPLMPVLAVFTMSYFMSSISTGQWLILGKENTDLTI